MIKPPHRCGAFILILSGQFDTINLTVDLFATRKFSRAFSRAMRDSIARGEVPFHHLGFNADEFHDLYLIKPNHRFAINDRYGRALIPHIDQLFQRCLIGAHIFFHKLDTLLR